MSECYPFKSDHTLISQENIIWNDQDNAEKTSIPQFSIAAHGLSENECFVTSDGTEYLSELETTNDIAFSDLHNLALEHSKIDIADNIQFENTEDQNTASDLGNQVIVFKIDGSDDLYGVQMVQDEHGNIEKYQFKFGTNENGELEAIPDTIQLLPNEDSEKREEFLGEESDQAVQEVEENELKILVQEDNSSENVLPDENILQNEADEETEEIEVHTGNGFIEEEETESETDKSLEPKMNNVKEELISEDSLPSDENEDISEAGNCKIEYHETDELSDNIQNVYLEEIPAENEGEEEDENNYDRYEEIYIDDQDSENVNKEPFEEDSNNMEGLIDNRIGVANESENDFDISDELPITADTEQLNIHEPETILQTALEQPPNSNILKQYGSKVNAEGNLDNKVIYYIVQHVQLEKENLNNSVMYKPLKANPRSILKTSYSVTTGEELIEYDERLEKRFAKSKEAIQARLFHNFITKTTIPQAPIRNERLPRKQKIKPVNERVDEEIIVQEVMVSSNGVIETIESSKMRRDHATVTEYVDLTDSEDEDNFHKAKNTGSESDVSVIEIFNSEDEVEETPKKRGRPRKSAELPRENENEKNNFHKKKRGRPPLDKQTNRGVLKESISTNNEIKCPRCPKTFPNQNSLNTHIQHHNLETSLLNSQQSKNANVVEYKHKCKDCEATFKNTILLNKHICSKVKKLECSMCKKKFTDVSRFNFHKRLHVKENVLKSTSSLRISPNKCPPDLSKTDKPKVNNFKCKDCSKAFISMELLRSHSQTHKRFECSNCTKSFTSRILLDTHVRIKCVKYKSPQNRRLSFKTRKSFSFNRRSSLTKINKSILNSTTLETTVMSTPSSSNKTAQINCENCSSIFSTHRELFKHKVAKHGLETPDKTVLFKTRKTSYKQMNTHGGIPVNERLRKAYAGLKQKLECSQNP